MIAQGRIGSGQTRERWMNRRPLVLVNVMVWALAAAGCSGGGGGGSSSPPGNTPPAVDAGANQTVVEGTTVQLAGSGSDVEGAVTFAWTQLSGPPISFNNPSIAGPSFVAPLVATPSATVQLLLTVTDSAGASTSDTVTVTVNDTPAVNTPPLANAGADQSVNEGMLVQLAGSGSDAEGPVTYAWTQVSGPAVTFSSTTAPTPTFTAPLIGAASALVELRLTVTDAGGLAVSDIVTIAVNEVPGGVSGRVLQIAAGAIHMCALLDTNATKCWGDNASGKLGLGDVADRGDAPDEMGNNLPAVNLGTGRRAVELALGLSHSCARLDNGAVKCWGGNAFGQLGLGDTEARGDQAGEMGDSLPAVNLGAGRTAVELGLGASFTCARLDNGTAKCWGLLPPIYSPGNINVGDAPGEMGDALPALNFGAGLFAVQLAVPVAASFACARLNNGAVKCWANLNSSGQLGTGSPAGEGLLPQDMGDNLPAVNLGTGRTAVDLVASGNAGRGTVCAILDNGATKCWGDNGNGQPPGAQLSSGLLGLGDTLDRGDGANEMGNNLPAVDFGSGLAAQVVALGTNNGCAILNSNQLKCWGNFAGLGSGLFPSLNAYGDQPAEMGNNLPVINLGTAGGNPLSAVQVAVGTSTVCALLNTGDVKCWGGNGAGEAGQGNTTAIGWLANQMGDNLAVVQLGM
jgi:hypothetical protein